MAEKKNIPTNDKLWAKVIQLAKGELKELSHNGKTVQSPNEGKGFTKYPSAYANGWAAKVYKDMGGKWKKESSDYKFPRKFDKAHCESKTCDEMGFSERASCAPYKKCPSPKKVASIYLASRPIPLDMKKLRKAINSIEMNLRYSLQMISGGAIGMTQTFRQVLPKAQTVLAETDFDIVRMGGQEETVTVMLISDKRNKFNQRASVPKVLPKAGWNNQYRTIILYLDSDLTVDQVVSRSKGKYLKEEIRDQILHELTHGMEHTYGRTIGMEYDHYINDPYEIRASLQVIIDQLFRLDPQQVQAVAENMPFEFVLNMSKEYQDIKDQLTEDNKLKLMGDVYQALTERGMKIRRRFAKGKAKKDVGKGGLDEWFSGHGQGKNKDKGEATWGDWVAISPVKRTITKEDGTKKTYEAGDIIGPCGSLTDDPNWKDLTQGGKSPLKCMARPKAHKMKKEERAELAKNKMKAEKGNNTQKPTMTPTFKKEEKKKEKKAMKPNAQRVAHRYLRVGKKDFRIHHKSYTSAMQEAYYFAEKNGYQVDEEDIFQQVTTGRGKPSVGETRKHSLLLTKNGKPQRKALQVQVYGMDSGTYELNVYIL